MKKILILILILILPIVMADKLGYYEQRQANSYVFCDDDVNGLIQWDYLTYKNQVEGNIPCKMPSYNEKVRKYFDVYNIQWGNRDANGWSYWDRINERINNIALAHWQFKVNFTNMNIQNKTYYAKSCIGKSGSLTDDNYHCDRLKEIIDDDNFILICSHETQECESLEQGEIK